ncbi:MULTISPECIES: Rpn family recombination-promoting nuclease/putative transposase [Enterobacteriaceae]|uniref:Rpn family recombination-promoting nuclease/putative transposase n=1 Tax=Enterobacteriaceae TaxID=543 RepID=UPI000D258CFA|nr:Rpn family recombination-promoting nuclease/putative transposase [Escherichia coli]MDO5405039.1 Rpn family recombination-promoting nuclease/putative transposase [Proteus sp. (in: enterobacteria)]AVZ57698.1 ISNCY family transposase [Escherichia coli]EFC1622855.1 Rpn family recombination-promoting nuclease/putative transposase [Escherichia coli]EFC1632486.1 Rpn family recombination-promoting nuclease/putative transposase [Escherichia coli]EFC1646195.1 Rpn family recombination-promoting nuclea
MTKNTQQPVHDALFKQFLTHPDNARDFFAVHLPANILPLCDLSTLRLEPASFVERRLRQLHSDVLYSVQTTEGEGYIYCLIEHQSKPDRLMGFRLMHYAMSAISHHLKKSPADKTLPLVVPFLFYQGSVCPYPYSMNWLDGFADPALAQQLYTRSFPLVDLSVLSDEEILTHKGVALLELVQKHIRTRDGLMAVLPIIAQIINSQHNTVDQVRSVMEYIAYQGYILDESRFFSQLIALSPEYKTMLTTIAEQLEQKGIEKGREEGIEVGIEKGRTEALIAMTRSLLQQGVDLNIIMQCTGLTREKIESLKH